MKLSLKFEFILMRIFFIVMFKFKKGYHNLMLYFLILSEIVTKELLFFLENHLSKENSVCQTLFTLREHML